MLKISPFRRNKKILTATTLADAVRGCDTYATKEVLQGTIGLGLLRMAKWRWEPASESQKQFILKRWKARKVLATADGEGKSLLATDEGLKTMKKGEAANIITRLKHGAQVRDLLDTIFTRTRLKFAAQARYEKRKKEQAKLVLAVEKEKSRRAREDVKVGRLVA